jgi:hypothetical protein
VYTGPGEMLFRVVVNETQEAALSLLCGNIQMDKSMSCIHEEPGGAEGAQVEMAQRRTMLCSLKIVPVSSEHFLGRRYVMELTTTGRARELRVFRSLEQLMTGVRELGLRPNTQDDLRRQLLEEGQCDLLDIAL